MLPRALRRPRHLLGALPVTSQTMDGSNKRRRLDESTASRRRKGRNHEMNTSSVMRAMAAALVVVAATTAGMVHTMQGPEIRRSVYEPPRLDWETHAEDLEERGCFKRMYRMPRPTFEKLADLLAPLLLVNAHFARECCWAAQWGWACMFVAVVLLKTLG